MNSPTNPQFVHFFFIFINYLCFTDAENIFLNCGSSSNSIDLNGREWAGDSSPGSKFVASHQPNETSIVSKATNLNPSIDPVPYLTARIFQSPFTYSFPVTPGHKFLRLFFNPSAYHGFQSPGDFFTVTAGPFTLLTHFSPSLTAQSLGLKTLDKEFCLHIQENQVLNITFSPSLVPLGAFAFVNGIEIISMPTDLYYKSRARPMPNGFAVPNSTALELMHRLNIGGDSISPANDSGLYRRWLDDEACFVGSGDRVVNSTAPIKYWKIAPFVAPARVYQTARCTNKQKSLSWNLTVDSGFTYFVRLHLCELHNHPEVTKHGRNKFVVRIGNGKTEAVEDVITWSGRRGVAVYRDHVVKMPKVGNYGKTHLFLSLGNNNGNNKLRALNSDPILNGLEVFKLSDSQGNLAAGVNPVSKIPEADKSRDRKLVFIISGATLAAFTLILLLGLTIFILRRKESNEKDKSVTLRGLCRRFTLEELRDATNNFDRALVIGNGGFGRVFKGCIDGGTPVAIKALKPTSTQGSKEFETEIKMLSDLRYRHLVSLIGCCDEGVKIIVYEYMPGGTLRDHLYSTKGPPLSWKQRLEISIGVARGIKYLHGQNTKIIHRDIKPSNILLDDNLVSKVSDFGLSRFGPTSLSRSHVTTGVRGTFGYVDPEYFETSRLSVKSDVYSFGVVLFEMLCARPAVDLRLDDEQPTLAEWVRRCIKVGKLKQIMDPNLKGQISPGCLKAYVGIALKCLNNDRHKRPTMAAVLKKLKRALELQECTDAASDDDGEDEEEIMNNNDKQLFLKPNKNAKVVHSCPTFWNKTISRKELLRFLSDRAGLKWSTPPSLSGLKTLCYNVSSYGTMSGEL
ncbi:hypothetical protein ES319_A12G052600v1 [Gossypium barbadense]|uniref:Protein kinase domain-containing protein n=2 Tax=Gossypium TaxID=3633 RepID=A0A5J5T6P2_GOSBA|nr:hypothetical protein ES319_A12G052600v1 [Gossypium barbadense]TYG88872.1 hypothetical protein ES288_A12G055500v1 [Gossypium darwinii]